MIEEGGEGLEQDNRELRRIVAYNDSRMGLASQGDKTKESEVRKTQSNKDDAGGHTSDEAVEDMEHHVYTFSSNTFPKEIFMTLKELQISFILTDLTLTTEDGSSFSVHSLILAAVSAFILDKLKEKNTGQSYSTQGKVTMWSVHMGNEVDQIGLQAVIEFAYSGDLSILNKDTLTQIKTAAKILEVPQLLDFCNNINGTKEDQCPKTDQDRISADVHLKDTLRSIERLLEDKVGCDVILELNEISFHGKSV